MTVSPKSLTVPARKPWARSQRSDATETFPAAMRLATTPSPGKTTFFWASSPLPVASIVAEAAANAYGTVDT